MILEVAVVAEVDEELGGPRVGRARLGEGDHPPGVGLGDRVVGDPRPRPGGGDLGIGVETALGHESADDPIEGDIVVIADLDQIVEPVDAVGRPRPVDQNDDIALGGFELDAEGVGSASRWRATGRGAPDSRPSRRWPAAASAVGVLASSSANAMGVRASMTAARMRTDCEGWAGFHDRAPFRVARERRREIIDPGRVFDEEILQRL